MPNLLLASWALSGNAVYAARLAGCQGSQPAKSTGHRGGVICCIAALALTTFPMALQDIGQLGFKFQFVTLAGFHAVNNSMFELAKGFAATGMGAYSELQQREFANEKLGYTATKHQREVGL